MQLVTNLNILVKYMNKIKKSIYIEESIKS